MSTVVSWITKDNHGFTSMYFISESRISWEDNTIWDYGQKVFSLQYGGIIAYCGNVLFPTQLISQLKDLIDKEILFKNNDDNSKKIHIIEKYIENAFNHYPQKLNGTTIIISLVQDKEFNSYELKFNDKKFQLTYLTLIENTPNSYGSGSSHFNTVFKKLEGDEIYSRDIYQSFVKAIDTTTDPKSGGSIQLVGIYRNSESKTFGIINKDEKFIYGQKITSLDIPLNISWRNENFEIVDIENMKIKSGAQKQPFNKKL
jgi:hypothetical protein